jgi:hypothetical protein
MRIGAAISEMKNLSPRPQPLLKITGDMTLTFALQFQAFCRCDPAAWGKRIFARDWRPPLFPLQLALIQEVRSPMPESVTTLPQYSATPSRRKRNEVG